MRHVYIRSILAFIWLVAAMISGLSGSIAMAALYIVMGGVFFCSAYTLWKKEKKSKGDE